MAVTSLASFAAQVRATEWIELASDGRGFVQRPSGRVFIPWGFNYDRDSSFRLIEDYWHEEWATVRQDFEEMKQLGANVVRVHLQFAKFMDAPDRPNQANLQRLRQLVDLAEAVGVYLDLTGLGAYRRQDTPAWYDALDEPQRWAAQAQFWQAIAAACADRPAVWCYNLINEPIVAGEKRTEWVHPQALENLHYVQYINLDPAGRQRTQIARQWVSRMVGAIRQHDRRHLITVGIIPIEIGPPENAAGFAPTELADQLDFFSFHIYPEADRFDPWIQMLERCSKTGRPIVIEETFPLRCDAQSLQKFIHRTAGLACGWIGFYWGKAPAELAGSSRPADQLTLQWLELFQRMNPQHSGWPTPAR
ncbi:cellulase family glycosylhydrolase [Fontivita pretiosa]|uniref:cellulase family glycosylhydrolase n=1 Tax=Fontivita pretiosa TaxID=2989684 RepID=UPI003D162946